MFFVAVKIFMKVITTCPLYYNHANNFPTEQKLGKNCLGNLNKSYKISNEQREYVSKETVVLRRLESITGQLISIIN